MSDKIYNIIRLIIIVIALFICFLYALNGRYVRMSDRYIIDSWTDICYRIQEGNLKKHNY